MGANRGSPDADETQWSSLEPNGAQWDPSPLESNGVHSNPTESIGVQPSPMESKEVPRVIRRMPFV
eukprot:7126354-Lingulodinium_polyedra.AAC.1